jgi:hypothetical protein
MLEHPGPQKNRFSKSGDSTMQARSAKVKKMVPVKIGNMTIGIILGQADPAQAVTRVSQSLERHGWLSSAAPRELVRVGGVV